MTGLLLVRRFLSKIYSLLYRCVNSIYMEVYNDHDIRINYVGNHGNRSNCRCVYIWHRRAGNSIPVRGEDRHMSDTSDDRRLAC